MPLARSATLVLVDSPLRERLRALSEELEALRDEVGQLELECETLRADLATFEARHRRELEPEQRWLKAIDSVVRHLERWVELLEASPPRERAVRARRLERRRTREMHREVEDPEMTAADEPAPESPAPGAALKSLYRRLARRFHPDLARTEEEQIRHAALMTQINGLYRAGDLARLEALADQALGAELPEPVFSQEEEVQLLEERRVRFQSVRDGLRDELRALERCATAELLRRARAAEQGGEDLFRELRRELRARANLALKDVRAAARALEGAVRRANRDSIIATKRRTLARSFDPLGRQALVRLSLESLEHARATTEVRQEAQRLIELAGTSPAAARLVLFAYASELVPHPLEGLRTVDEIAERFQHLSAGEAQPQALERALVEAAHLVEFGVRRAGERLVTAGLRFRSAELREAVPLALRSHVLRTEFRRVLAALGERTACPECGVEVFTLPLYRLRGLDDLHAAACPRCGLLIRSYFLPRGQDVQSVLNTAFLDLELLTEWTFRMGTASVSMQLLPAQLEGMTVGQLKRRFCADVLERHEVPISPQSVRLLQGKRVVNERRKLDGLDGREFRIAFSAAAEVSVPEALEMVRHRIRTRFRPVG